MCGLKVPKIMEVILLVGNFDRAIFVSVWGGGGKYFLLKSQNWADLETRNPTLDVCLV